MTFVGLALLGLGVSDLVRWTPDPVGLPRAIGAALVGAAAVTAFAALCGFEDSDILGAAIVALVVLPVWTAYDLIPSERARPEYPVALIIGLIGILKRSRWGRCRYVVLESRRWLLARDFRRSVRRWHWRWPVPAGDR